MKVYNAWNQMDQKESLAVALGQFDGVHKAHQEILQRCVAFAKQEGIKSAVYTFINHPQVILSDDPPDVLTTLDERLERLKVLEVDITVAVPFDQALSHLDADAFLKMLCTDRKVAAFFCGYDYRFGKGGMGTPQFLKNHERRYGYRVWEQPSIEYEGEVISSTRIRHALRRGDLDLVKKMLGWVYGGVVKDFGRESVGEFCIVYGLMEDKAYPKVGDYLLQVAGEGEPFACYGAVYGRNITLTVSEENSKRMKKQFYVEFLERVEQDSDFD